MISIITPTFNRASTLVRLFDSLLKQSCKDFEWIIVDDGSVDETRKVVNDFIREKKLNIKYIFQENQGKPSALNNGLENATHEYVFPVDSDDILTEDSITTIVSRIKFHEYKGSDFSGLCFRKGDLKGVALGKAIQTENLEFIFCSATDIKNIFQVDMAYCFKKEYMLVNKFPNFDDEKFVPELFVWNKITDIFPVYVYLNKIIYLCEYLPDGLSANFKSQLKSNPNGFLVYYKDQIFREVSFKNKLKMIIRALQCYFYRIMR